MLSYRRETALQGALYFSPKVEDWNGRQYFTDIIGLSSTIVIKSAWKSVEFREKKPI